MSRKVAIAVLSLLVIAFSIPYAGAQGWKIYDASVLPAETSSENNGLDLTKLADNSPGAGMVQEILDDPDIEGNKIFIGMSEPALIASWGFPNDVNQSAWEGGASDQYVYRRGSYKSQYVYIENDIVTGWN